MSSAKRIGYARCAASPADVGDQDAALAARHCDRTFLDTAGLTGPDQPRPELERALACCNRGDVLVVTSLARLVTSLPDAAASLARLADRGIRLEVAGTPVDPADAEYLRGFSHAAKLASDLVRLHTRAGIAAAAARRTPQPHRRKLDEATRARVRRLHADGNGTSKSQLARDFHVSRATISRALTDDVTTGGTP